MRNAKIRLVCKLHESIDFFLEKERKRKNSGKTNAKKLSHSINHSSESHEQRIKHT